MSRVAITTQIHRQLQKLLYDGAIAIDATAGNGHDTLFLASQLQKSGKVFAFDIQQQAIDASHIRLCEAGLRDTVALICCGHEHLLSTIPTKLHGHIAVIMFNLGYLPGSDKSLITKTETTIAALNQALLLIAPDGIISVLAYPGHTGGREEYEALLAWADRLPKAQFSSTTTKFGASPKAPVWLAIRRTGA